jgi:hypothetical protein
LNIERAVDQAPPLLRRSVATRSRRHGGDRALPAGAQGGARPRGFFT